MADKIFDLTPFFLAHVDRDLRYMSISRSYAALLGLEPEDIVGKRVVDIVGPAGFEVMRPRIEAALAGRRVEYEAKIKIRDQEPRDYQVALVPDRDEHNDVAGYVVSVIDVTERNKATEEKARLEKLIAEMRLPHASAQIGIWAWDMRADIVTCTPEHEAIFGVGPGAMKTVMDFRNRVHPDDIDDLFGRRDEAVKAHKTFQVEFRIVRPDGMTRWVQAVAGAAYDPVTGEPVRIMGNSIDITERKSSEVQAELQRHELMHLMRIATLGGLSGGIAHELSQPLASILANAQAMQVMLAAKNPNLEMVAELVDEIVQQDSRAGEVIRRLRKLLQKAGRYQTQIDMNELIASSLQLLRSDLVSRKIKIETELKTDLPAITGDPVELQQVLINLILNAMEAMALTPASERALNIATAITKEKCVEVFIIDHGPGMSSDDLKRVFLPFFTTKVGGLGLGLSICSSIVASHHGQLTLGKASGGGIVATISLPQSDQLAMAS